MIGRGTSINRGLRLSGRENSMSLKEILIDQWLIIWTNDKELPCRLYVGHNICDCWCDYHLRCIECSMLVPEYVLIVASMVHKGVVEDGKTTYDRYI